MEKTKRAVIHSRNSKFCIICQYSIFSTYDAIASSKVYHTYHPYHIDAITQILNNRQQMGGISQNKASIDNPIHLMPCPYKDTQIFFLYLSPQKLSSPLYLTKKIKTKALYTLLSRTE